MVYDDEVRILANDENLNPVQNLDGNGQKIKWPDTDVSTINEIIDLELNTGRSNAGRFFGRIPRQNQTYKLIRSRGEIQLGNGVEQNEIILISDGVTLSAANTVNPYAVECIKDYISYMRKEHDSMIHPSQARAAKSQYNNTKRLLKARLNELGYAEIVKSIIESTHQGLK